MRNLKKFILLSHIIFISINFANAQQSCLDTGNFTANSTYAKNRDQILSSLAPNVSANNDRFFNTSIGEEPNKVYALGLCVLDITSESCFNCVNYTSQKVTEKCPNQKGAIFWEGAVGGPCLVRYSSSSFLGKLELEPKEAAGYSTGGVSFNRTEFDPIWAALMERVVERASSGSSKVKYATEEVERPPFQNIYAQMQCTPYLSQSDCSKCLRANVASYKECCHDKLGGYAQRPSCTLRWNLVPFYNASVSPPAPPPPPSSSPRVTTNANEDDDGGIKPGTVAVIVVPTITFIAFFALTCIFLIRRGRKPSKEVENADEVASVEVRIKVVNVDREKSRIGLSIRQLEEDPLLKTLDKVIPQDGSAGLDSLDMSNTIEPLPGLDSILQELLQEDGIDEVRINRQGFEKRVVSQDLQLWLSNAPPLDNKSTLLARAGRQVQEIQLTTSLDQEGIKKALQRVLERVP